MNFWKQIFVVGRLLITRPPQEREMYPAELKWYKVNGAYISMSRKSRTFHLQHCTWKDRIRKQIYFLLYWRQIYNEDLYHITLVISAIQTSGVELQKLLPIFLKTSLLIHRLFTESTYLVRCNWIMEVRQVRSKESKSKTVLYLLFRTT